VPINADSSLYLNLLSADSDGRNGLALQHVCNFGRGASLVDLKSVQTGGLQVDLTLRLNVLAVCAAIVFVGAVLLGAF
jgi:hypothetical protein